jgi:flagellar secretion chaperone FliS
MNARLSYREAAVPGASPLRLVTLLYEQAVEDLRCAREAHRRNDIEGRTRHINHAILVIGHLQASLDKEQGGRVAENLERFYSQLRSGLVEAQCKQSAAGLEQQISRLMLVHQAWCQAEGRETARFEAERANAASISDNATSGNATSDNVISGDPWRGARSREEQEGPERHSSSGAGWNA